MQMFGEVGDLLSAFGSLSYPLGWAALLLFLVGISLDYVGRTEARQILAAAWGLFAVFWLSLIYPWFVTDDSFVRGAGAVIAVPLSIIMAKTFWKGSAELITLTRAVAIMGVVYAPFLVIDPLREQLILMVTDHTAWAMSLIGYEPPVVTERFEAIQYAPDGFSLDRLDPENERYSEIPKEDQYENSFIFFHEDGVRTISYTIILACTGIGSMSVVIGLVAAVNASLRRKVRAIALAVGIIYVLNIVRNVFIGINFGHQYMHWAPDTIMWLFMMDNELRVSYIWADRILAQIGSVIAMLIIFYLVLREVPEIMEPIEEVIYLATGEQYDLSGALDIDPESEKPEPSD